MLWTTVWMRKVKGLTACVVVLVGLGDSLGRGSGALHDVIVVPQLFITVFGDILIRLCTLGLGGLRASIVRAGCRLLVVFILALGRFD